MHLRLLSCIIVLIGFTIDAQTNVNVRGKVTNLAGKAIANATVTLVRQGMKATTGADGAYTITGSVAVLPEIFPQTDLLSLHNGILAFTLSNPSPVKVEMFDVKGNLLKKEVLRGIAAGEYRLNVGKNLQTTKLLVIKATIGNRAISFRYLPLNDGKFTFNSDGESSTLVDGGLAKMAAVVDTVKTTAANYQAKSVTITSYDQELNITLDTVGGGSTGSIGCGKDLSSIKSGTYTITSASLSRQYIIDIPANYDKNKPYRLIFGMHCYGSSMQGVVNEKFYSLKPLADNAKVSCIWVAPNGTGSGTPLWDKGEQDHTFFNDMLKLFKENLCIDTARVFSCGFSYGAMFTYSLSLSHQKQLRAVACYAPANWNIWLPTIVHEPIAFYSTTGTDDPNCKYIYDDAKKLGGKYCVLQHIEDNGCPIPTTIPTATSGKHVTTEFPGCKEGYPVIFGSFQGQHACVVSDQGSNVNWIAAESWNFFMRF
jgi:poly(3-hydroxybutyrate) depolymerase